MALRNEEIGERIAELRAQAHKPQPVVADAIGVSLRAYQNWEAGDSKPNYGSLERLAAFFGVSENYILTGIEPAAETPDPFKLSDQLGEVVTEFRPDVDRVLQTLEALDAKIDANTALVSAEVQRNRADIDGLYASLARMELKIDRLLAANGTPERAWTARHDVSTPEELAAEAERLARVSREAQQQSSPRTDATR